MIETITINKLKNKLNKVIILLLVLVVILLISVIEVCKVYYSNKQMVQNGYNRAMYETVGYIKNVEAELAKLEVTTTKSLMITSLASVWKQSNLAKDNFELLPLEQQSLDNTSKYLAQLSDYSYFLMKELTIGDTITDKDYENISKLYTECKNISLVMSNIYNDLNSGNIKWDELQKIGNEKLKNEDISSTISNIEQIGKTFQEYEGLIYDGAFSDHILTSKPKYLNDKEYSFDNAKEYIEKIFGKDNTQNLEYIGLNQGRIELYNFNLKLKDSDMVRNIYITKKDCKLYLMLGDRSVQNENIVEEAAIDYGIEFLKKIGIDNMKETYYQKVDNTIIINYAAKQDNILLYPDLVKVKVALDTGEICSVEAQGYIFNHTKREDIIPKLSMEDALKIVSKKVKILSKELVIIPTESQSEVLCYEFKGKIEDREVLIYINAKTGNEEKVLLILETPGGTLTV